MRLKHFISLFVILLTLGVGSVWAAASLTGNVVYSCTPASVASNSAYNNYSGTLNRSANTELVENATWQVNSCSNNGNMGANKNSQANMKLSQGNYNWASAIATAIGKTITDTYVDAAVCITEFPNVGKFTYSGCSTTPSNFWLCYSTDDWSTATAIPLTVAATGEYEFPSTIASARYAFVFYHTTYTTIKPTLTFYEGISGPSCEKVVNVVKGDEDNTKGTFTLSKSGEQASCDGFSVEVTPTAATHYHLAATNPVTASNPATSGTATVTGPSNGKYTVTYSANAEGNSTIDVAFEQDAQYTVNWHVNGQKVHDQTGYAGVALTDIPEPAKSDCDGEKEFVGWFTEAYSHATDAPAFVSPTTIPEGGADYYAVFATPANGDATAEFNPATTAGLTNSFRTWTHTKSGITLELAGNETYSVKTENTWQIGYNKNNTTQNYLELNSTATISKVEITLDAAANKVNSVTNGTLTTSTTDNTKQEINGSFTTTKLYPDAANSKQAHITNLVVTYAGTVYSNYATTCCSKLSAPTNVSATATGATTATVIWDAVENANGYQYKLGDADWATAEVTGDETKTLSLTGLTGVTSYSIQVRATGTGDYCAAGVAANAVNFKTHATVTAATNDNEKGTAQVSLDNSNWASSVAVAEGTLVYLKATPIGTNLFDSWATSNGTLTNAENATTTLEAESWTGDVTVTATFVPAQKETLPTPTGLASVVTAISATIKWNVVTNASSYQYKLGNGEWTDAVVTVTEGVCSCELTGLTAGTQYSWQVKAIGDDVNYTNSDACEAQEFTTDAKAATSIEVTGTLTKSTYVEGETFDPAGLTITVHYNTGESDNEYTITPNPLTLGTSSVTITSNLTGTVSTTVNGITVQKKVVLTFMNNGTEVVHKDLSEGAAYGDLPTLTASAACDPTSTTFIGWTNGEIVIKQNDQPTLAEATDVMGESNVTLYAVWAKASATPAADQVHTWSSPTWTTATAFGYGVEQTVDIDGKEWKYAGYAQNGNSYLQVNTGSTKLSYFYFPEYDESFIIKSVAFTLNNNSSNSVFFTDTKPTTAALSPTSCANVSFSTATTLNTEACAMTSGYVYYNGSAQIKSVSVTYAKSITYTDYMTTCSDDVHTITVATGLTGGEISAATAALEGEEVSLTATPAAGYNFDAWMITKTEDASDVTASVLSGNTLTMPEYDVTVSATFVAKPMTGLTLSATEITADLAEGTKTLTVTAYAPEDLLDAQKTINWSSSAEAVATVDGGVITMHSKGSAIITAAWTQDADVKATCTLNVYEYDFVDYTVETAPATSYTDANQFDKSAVVIKANYVRSDDPTNTKQETLASSAWTANLDGTEIADEYAFKLADNGKTLALYVGLIEVWSETITVTAEPKDHFVDNIWNTVISDKAGEYSSMPTIENQEVAEGSCQDHNIFVGWVEAAHVEAPTDADLVTGVQTASNKTFYAVWAKQESGLVDRTMKYSWEAGESTTGWTVGNTTPVSSVSGSAITPHDGSKFVHTASDMSFVKTSSAIENPQTLTIYVARTSNNTSSTVFAIQTCATANGTYSDVAVKSINELTSKDTWYKFEADLTSYHNVYVNFIKRGGGNAVRAIDDVTLTYKVEDTYNTDYIAECVQRYTMSYNANGGTGSYESVELKEGATLTLPDGNEMSKEWHTFTGWKANNEGDLLLAGAEFTVGTANVEFYAQWQEVSKANVIFKDGDDVIETLVGIHEGESYDMHAAPTSENQFTGWKSSVDGSMHDADETGLTMGAPAVEIVYTAQWLTLLPITEPDYTKGEWVLVTDENQINAGDVVVIAAKEYEYALGAKDSDGKYRVRVAVAKNADNSLSISDNVTKLFLQNGYGDNQFGLYDLNTASGNEHYLYDVNGQNQLKAKESLDQNGSWEITISDGVTTIKSKGVGKYIEYNANANQERFSCYNGSQADVVLYKFVETYKRESVSESKYGTICLPNGGVMVNGMLLEIAYRDEDQKKIFFDEIINGVMEAGRPYVFLPNEGVTELKVRYTDNANAAAGNYRGLYGSFVQEVLEMNDGNYILYNNQYLLVNSQDVYVGANRAYIRKAMIPTEAPAQAPGRRRVSMNVVEDQSTTGIDARGVEEAPRKVMIDGTMYIIRGEKMYDATGKAVK